MNRTVAILALAALALAAPGCLAQEEYWTFGLTRNFQDQVSDGPWILSHNPLTEVLVVFFVMGDLVLLPVALIHDFALALSAPFRWLSAPEEGPAAPGRRSGRWEP